jgi:hypothetical protein
MRRTFYHLLPIVLTTIILLVAGCSDQPPAPSSETPQQKDITLPTRTTPALSSGTATEWVGPSGGVVGGRETFGNIVYFAPGALSKLTKISVSANPRTSEVEFNPSMKFNRDVTVGLSLAGFGLSARQSNNIKIYWYNESQGRWRCIDPNPTVNLSTSMVWFSTNHFSRYAWSDDSTGGGDGGNP